MARASSADTAARWAQDRAIDLWVTYGEIDGLELADCDQAVVAPSDDADPFAIFGAMRLAGVSDVRRVGVVATRVVELEAARRAGVGAVVALADEPAAAAELLRAEPDAVVPADQLGALEAIRYGRARPRREAVLLNPGPALTTEGVKRAALAPDVCHREPEWAGVEQRVRSKLREVAEVDDRWEVALLAGSGTVAVEAAVHAAVRPGRRLLVVENGVYGERIRRMAEQAGIETDVARSAWVDPVDPGEVETMLAAGDFDAVALVHHETTTGLLNPAAEVAAAARTAGALVVLDAVSSFGAEDFEASAVDFLACSANKCLHGLPGTSFVLVSPAGAERAREVPARTLYLDLAAYLDGARAGSPPFTPAVPAVSALEAALDEVLAEGARAHRERYVERAAVLDAELDGLGLEQLIAPEHRSRSIRSVRLPSGVDFAELHDRLKADGYVIYAGQGSLSSEIFRVACMGALEPDALRGFAGRLRAALQLEPARA